MQNGRLFVKTLDESPAVALLKATEGNKFVVRISGGCGLMDKAEEKRMMSFAQAFRYYYGTVIAGGTRMIYKDDFSKIRPGVTELLRGIKKINPKAITFGLIPRIIGQNMVTLWDGRIAFTDCDEEKESKKDFFTTILPGIDISLILQKTADKGVIWDDEYRTALEIMLTLRRERGYGSLSLFYNGGPTSEKEMLATVHLGWPVALISNSGRMCDKYCNDETFLQEHSNVYVVDSPRQLKRLLWQLQEK